MDSESLSKAPREVTLAGKTYLVSKLEYEEWNLLRAWIKDHAVDPVVAMMDHMTRAKAAGITVSDEDRKLLYETARQEAKVWPPMVGSDGWFSVLLTTDGASERFLSLVLKKHNPAISDEELARINRDASGNESRLLIYRALGFDPPPKADAPAAVAQTQGQEQEQPAEPTPMNGPQ